jgi:hypothetical protein
MIANYGELKTRLTRLLFHSRFIDDYEQAVLNFESSANRRLRVRPMETYTTFTTGDVLASGEAELPTNYSLWRTVLFLGTTPYTELDYVHPAYLTSTPASEGSSPCLFTIEGEVIKIRPINDTADIFQLHYYELIPTITTSDGTSNWLLLAHPDVYEFGALVELAALGRNVEMAALYKQRRDETFQEIILSYAFTTGASSSKVREAEYY